MKKRVLSLIVTAIMVCSMLPTTAHAAETATASFSETNVTWIGTQAEYQKTLDNMFVDGMRKMKAGDKWGIVDATGQWVAPPIYDKIELNYLIERDSLTGDAEVSSREPLEVLFLDGYNVVSGAGATATGRQMVRQMLDKSSALSGLGGGSDPDSGSMMIDFQEMKLPNDSRLAAEHDYMDGYTFVVTGRGAGDCAYGTILDSSSKEILPGRPYMFRGGLYPQFGPYMVYIKQSDKSYSSDYGDLGKPYLSGVVGPEGVIIPAQYTGGVRSPITGWYVGDARMTVIPELKLVVTAKDTTPGKENGGKVAWSTSKTRS